MEHTKGPFRARQDGPCTWHIKSVDYGGIATLHDPYAQEQGRLGELEANAKLLASSTDLERALDDIIVLPVRLSPQDAIVEAVKIARAAIAKARPA